MEIPNPLGLKDVALEVRQGIKGVAELPALIDILGEIGDLAPSARRIADFESTLEGLAQIVPAIEQIGRLGTTLDDLARVAPALEQLAGFREVFERLLVVLESLSGLTDLVPVLEAMKNSMQSLEVTMTHLSDTITPLQGTAIRVGKVVDRLATRKTKEDKEFKSI